MSFSRDEMRNYMGLTRTVYKVAKSVQQTIPICRISDDGIFQIEPDEGQAKKRFDKAYLFSDTNFTTMNAEERENFRHTYVGLLNSLNVSYKILIINANRDLQKMRDEIYLKNTQDNYPEVADAYNEIISENLQRGKSGIEQLRVFVISCDRQDLQSAEDYFRTVEASLELNFKRLSSKIIPFNAKERLRLLHNFYRLGKEDEFHFDYPEVLRRHRDFRNDICPASIMHNKDQYGRPDGETLIIDGRYVRVLYAREFPNALTESYIRQISEVSFPCMITMDYAPVPQAVARKRLYDLYMKNGNAINKEQEVHNNMGNFAADISYDKRRQRDRIELALNLLSDNDEKMSYFGLYLAVSAKTYEELQNHVLTLMTISEGVGIGLKPAMYRQIEALNTCLPLAVRQVQYMRTVFSSNLCAFMPFNVQEVYEKGGLYYGINAISRNPIVGDRKKLPNGNGVIMAATGMGKSMKAKAEIGQVLVNTMDDVIIIDPHNEYEPLTKYFKGQFINVGMVGKTKINPLDCSAYGFYDSKQTFLYDKVTLMQTIVSQMMERDLTAAQKSLVVRCTEAIYKRFFENPRNKKLAPTIAEFYESLQEQPEIEAHEIAMAVERFLSGALNVFAGPGNVDTKNRFVVYGLADLGEALFGVGIIVMLETIRSRIAQNFRRGVATWIYVDEFHVLSRYELSAKYLDKIWREVRKMGGLITGIDQKISEMLENKTVETMLANSSYIALLGQADAEISYIRQIMDINENEIEILRQAAPGCGLTKWGDKILPTEFLLPKESLLYQMYNTNFHEMTLEKAPMQKPRKKRIMKETQNLELNARISVAMEKAGKTLSGELFLSDVDKHKKEGGDM